MKNVNDLLTELSQGSTQIISQPETVEQLIKEGVVFDKIKQKRPEEIVADLFEKRQTQALENINKLPSPPNIAIPTISTLYDEIRECILFGLYGAAISLSAVLVEFSLKHAIVKHKFQNVYQKAEWDRIENIELGPTIKEAKELKIIDDEMDTKLREFKNDIRNPYLHYNIKKITGNVVARKVKRLDIKTKEVVEVDLVAEDNPFIWSTAKRFVDKDYVLSVFNFADMVVKYLFQ